MVHFSDEGCIFYNVLNGKHSINKPIEFFFGVALGRFDHKSKTSGKATVGA